MKLVVIGATGRVGRQVVEQALAMGHEVIAVVRRPEAMTVRHDRLDVVRGDVLDPASLEKPIAASDAVISVVGSPDRKTTLVYSSGVVNIARAMDASGVRRLVCLSSIRVEPPRDRLVSWLLNRFIVQKVLRNRLLDMERMELELRHSDLDWTVVRLPDLHDGPRTGRYRTAVNGRVRHARSLSRADVADYVLAHLGDESTFRAIVEVAG